MKKYDYVVVVKEYDNVLERISSPARFLKVKANSKYIAAKKALDRMKSRRGYDFIIDGVYINAKH